MSGGGQPQQSVRRVLAITSATTFLGFLDVTIVNLAFPDLRADFGDPSVAELSWVITAYAVLFAALLTPSGRLADLVGRRQLFLVGIGVFTAASIMSTLAPSIEVLIGARAIQGLGAALMIPSALGLVLAAAAPEFRTQAVGIWGAAAGMSAAVGPSLGGLLVDIFSWRAVFLINVPIGIVLILAGVRALPVVDGAGRRVPDVAGTGVLTAGLILAVVGLTQANEWGWESVPTIACLVGALVALTIALLRARSHPAPAIETKLWRNSVFASANLSSLLFGGAMYSWMLVCVLFLVSVWDYSVLEAGLATSPGAFTAAVASVITGRRSAAGNQRLPVVAGALLTAAAGIWLVLALDREPAFLSIWLPAGLIAGLGMGACVTGLSSAVATAVAPTHFAAAAGLNLSARQVGGALGIAVLTLILEADVVPGINTYLDVFLFSSLTFIASGLAGLRLAGRARDSAEPTGVSAGEGSQPRAL